MNVRVHGQECVNPLGLMCRKVVRDDVDLLASWLVDHDVVEKGHELGRGIALDSLTQHLTDLGAWGRVQRQRAVAKLLEAVARSARHGDSGSIGSLRSSA